MSKKPQIQTKEAPKPKVEAIDEETDPVLKSLQKKIRNINKKLNEIADLEGKDSLKPQQIEKIGRKNSLLEERSRIEESAALFKQVYAENAGIYRNNQLKELEVLARAITILHFAPKVQQNSKTSSLWQSLQQTNFTNGTLNEAIVSLSNSLKDFANDRKLQKTLNTFIQEHGNDVIVPQATHQEQIVNAILQEQPQIVKIQTVPEVKEQIQVLENPVEQPVKAVELNQTITPAVVQTTNVEAEVKSNEASILNETKANNSQNTTDPVENKVSDLKYENNRKVGYKNNSQKGYARGQYQGNYNRERKLGEEKRQYKPKYAPKEREQKPQIVHESDSDSEPEVRQFRREEIKQLQNDGFIFIGKQKKPKQGVQYSQRT